MQKKKAPTFNDGIVKIYGTSLISEPGNMPKMGFVLKETLRLHQKTVGINRYYAGMQNNVNVDKVIRCLRRLNISTQDVAVLDDGKYKIVQIQYPEEVIPLVMDLSLERTDENYDID